MEIESEISCEERVLMEGMVESLESGCIEERIKTRCRKAKPYKKLCPKEERNASIRKVSLILQKSETERSGEESRLLLECSDTVEEVQSRIRKREKLKRRLVEYEDPVDELDKKCHVLAQAIAQSQHLVVYTGAGISTAAKIPDYRGSNGIWTRLQQGKNIENHDLSLAEPTYTHMALFELYKRNILKYVVSQNCDGLHLRSGLPRTVLSEVHGDMYLEVCKGCDPPREYWRLFDVTEKTARYAHKTMRKCYVCNGPLVDTIVHFGERGNLKWPQNWAGACKNAEKATTIICLGSSLKVLKKYPWLWQMDKPIKRRPNLYIVNLQWTPKDDFANVKIHGKCDEVMRRVMKLLDIPAPPYEKINDPIFVHATELCESEHHTTTQPLLKLDYEYKEECLVGDVKLKDKGRKSSSDLTANSHTSTCDISSVNSNNIQTQRVPNVQTSRLQCLPVQEKVAQAPKQFTIESILQRSVKQENVIVNQLPLRNYFWFPSYQLNLAAYNMNSPFSDYFCYPYPYQTSLLYSGLHSIISPSTFIKEEYVEIKNDLSEPEVKQEPACDFCYKNWQSLFCLFYSKTESRFVNPPKRLSKIDQTEKLNVCVCCDYTTDEDEEKDRKELEKEIKVQAGWFGKGYKKNGRVRRR